MPRACLLALGLLLACTQKPGSPTGDGKPSEPFTKCTSDDQCRLSCDTADSCCSVSCNCEQARHYDDHAKVVEERGNMCESWDYTSCPASDCSTRDYVMLPRCERNKCTAVIAEREPPPAPIDLSGYDRSCSADSDCALVNPQPCAKCGCTDEPIAVKEQDRFRKAMSDVKCPDYDPWPDIDCGACMDYEAFCEAGQCQSRPMR
jgi:hypothetical protein